MHRRWVLLAMSIWLACFSMNRAHATEGEKYQVKKGDSLWSISNAYHISVSKLKQANRLRSDVIHPGQTLALPTETKGRGLSLSKKDLDWLVRIIEAEAGGESFEGKVAVASVVLNRVLHEQYPDTVTKVIFDKIGNTYQFSPVGDGRIYKVVPTEDSYRAAKAALKGADPTSGALFFYNPKTARGSWIRSREVIAEIGKHQFAY